MLVNTKVTSDIELQFIFMDNEVEEQERECAIGHNISFADQLRCLEAMLLDKVRIL